MSNPIRRWYVAFPALLFALLAAACGDVRSLSPAIEPKDAIELPGIVGRWAQGDPDSLLYILEIERDTGRVKGYRVRLTSDSVTLDSTRAGAPVRVHHDTSTGWFDTYAGTIGGRFVLERTPPLGDAVLDRALERFDPLLITVYQLHPVTVTDTELRFRWLRADSSLALVRSGRCPTLYARDSTSNLTLTGDSRQVRRAYACLLAARGALDSMVFTRARSP